MEVYNSYVLDLEDELSVIESIFDKYIPTPFDALFIPNKRFPLDVKFNFSDLDIKNLRNTKYLPYKCLAFFEEALLNYLYMDSIQPEVYYTNELLEYTTPKMFVDIHKNNDAGELVREYIPDITTNEVSMVSKCLDSVFYKISNHISSGHDFIFKLNYESRYIVLSVVDNIWHFRYKECKEEIEYKKEVEWVWLKMITLYLDIFKMVL